MIVLASASERRAALLRSVGIRFSCLPQCIDESVRSGESPSCYVLRVAREKLQAARRQSSSLPVLSADTSVCCQGQILGKPVDRDDFMRMMKLLSGKRHQVLSAVALDWSGAPDVRTCLVTSEVEFRPLRDAEIGAYWATGEPADKAGGYAIQGLAAAFVRRLEGSYSSVVGLPLCETLELLAEAGIKPDWCGHE